MVASSLGPPPDDFFCNSFFPRGADYHQSGLEALHSRELPVSRSSLKHLRLVSLECLVWQPKARPTLDRCYHLLKGSEQLLELPQQQFFDFCQPPLGEEERQGSSKKKRPATASSGSGQKQHRPRQAPGGLPATAVPDVAAEPTESEVTVQGGPSNETTTAVGVADLIGREAAPVLVKVEADGAPGSPSARRRWKKLDEGTEADFSEADPLSQVSALSAESMALPTSAEPSSNLLCTCEGKGHCNHGRKPCRKPREADFIYCNSCRCSVPDCRLQQLRNLGLCYSHCHLKAAKELQMVKALGDGAVLPLLTPCDLEAFLDVCTVYHKRWSVIDPVFEVVAAWLKYPNWLEVWSKEGGELPPDSSAVDVLKALHRTIKRMSGQGGSKEMFFNLRSGRGIGAACCCRLLGVARPVTDVTAEPDEELVRGLGSTGRTWKLLQESCFFFCEAKLLTT